MNPKELGLPQKDCFELSLKLAAKSKYFQKGSFSAFEELYLRLRNEKRFGIDIRNALQISLKVIGYGPLGPKNFIDGYDYALSSSGLSETAEKSLAHGLKMAERSNRNEEPPVVSQ